MWCVCYFLCYSCVLVWYLPRRDASDDDDDDDYEGKVLRHEKWFVWNLDGSIVVRMKYDEERCYFDKA